MPTVSPGCVTDPAKAEPVMHSDSTPAAANFNDVPPMCLSSNTCPRSQTVLRRTPGCCLGSGSRTPPHRRCAQETSDARGLVMAGRGPTHAVGRAPSSVSQSGDRRHPALTHHARLPKERQRSLLTDALEAGSRFGPYARGLGNATKPIPGCRVFPDTVAEMLHLCSLPDIRMRKSCLC